MGTPKAVAVPAAAAVEKNLRRDAMTDMLCLRGMGKYAAAQQPVLEVG